MHARPIRSSLGPDPNGSAPVCTGPKTALAAVRHKLRAFYREYQGRPYQMHFSPVWIESKREQIQHGSALVCTWPKTPYMACFLLLLFLIQNVFHQKIIRYIIENSGFLFLWGVKMQVKSGCMVSKFGYLALESFGNYFLKAQ